MAVAVNSGSGSGRGRGGQQEHLFGFFGSSSHHNLPLPVQLRRHSVAYLPSLLLLLLRGALGQLRHVVESLCNGGRCVHGGGAAPSAAPAGRRVVGTVSTARRVRDDLARHQPDHPAGGLGTEVRRRRYRRFRRQGRSGSTSRQEGGSSSFGLPFPHDFSPVQTIQAALLAGEPREVARKLVLLRDWAQGRVARRQTLLLDSNCFLPLLLGRLVALLKGHIVELEIIVTFGGNGGPLGYQREQLEQIVIVLGQQIHRIANKVHTFALKQTERLAIFVIYYFSDQEPSKPRLERAHLSLALDILDICWFLVVETFLGRKEKKKKKKYFEGDEKEGSPSFLLPSFVESMVVWECSPCAALGLGDGDRDAMLSGKKPRGARARVVELCCSALEKLHLLEKQHDDDDDDDDQQQQQEDERELSEISRELLVGASSLSGLAVRSVELEGGSSIVRLQVVTAHLECSSPGAFLNCLLSPDRCSRTLRLLRPRDDDSEGIYYEEWGVVLYDVPCGMSIARLLDRNELLDNMENFKDLSPEELSSLACTSCKSASSTMLCSCCRVPQCSWCCAKLVHEVYTSQHLRVCNYCYRESSRIRHDVRGEGTDWVDVRKVSKGERGDARAAMVARVEKRCKLSAKSHTKQKRTNKQSRTSAKACQRPIYAFCPTSGNKK